jgi:glycosyltransferase involved in cell wall biosynthesis
MGTYEIAPPEAHFDSDTYFKLRTSKVCFKAFMRIYQRYFHFGYIYFLVRQIKKYRVEIVNFHNTGMVIPLLALPIIRLMKIKTIATFHDYTNVYNRKLYPSDLESQRILNIKTLFSRLISGITLNTNRKLFNFASNIVYLSPDQKNIYSKFKFPEGALIENKIEACQCEFLNSKDNAKPTIVFIGRRIGKGLDALIDWVENQDLFQLTLIGNEDLNQLAQARLPSHKFKFMGKLSSKEVYLEIHASTLLYAVSDCLDVYPTTVLEGIVHGKPVLVSKNCGNYFLISEIDRRFLIESIASIAPSELLEMSNTWDGNKKTSDIARQICDISQHVEAYKTLLGD